MPFGEWLEAHGHVPLPPYLNREDSPDDRERYQTVYAKQQGSVAAPTAGLHFTPQLTAELEAKGITIREVTLHVGAGTFRPISTSTIENHPMHAERFLVPSDVQKLVRDWRAERKGPIVAVGTTSLRSLESMDLQTGEELGSTRLMIRPGYRFKYVDGLITNFHQPRSTLICLVAAFVGIPQWRTIYQEAMAHDYRFLSFGDSSLLWRSGYKFEL
jgi:S-adenosylmethionine:tRNA ribosyltransferase-isomerase